MGEQVKEQTSQKQKTKKGYRAKTPRLTRTDKRIQQKLTQKTHIRTHTRASGCAHTLRTSRTHTKTHIEEACSE